MPLPISIHRTSSEILEVAGTMQACSSWLSATSGAASPSTTLSIVSTGDSLVCSLRLGDQVLIARHFVSVEIQPHVVNSSLGNFSCPRAVSQFAYLSQTRDLIGVFLLVVRDQILPREQDFSQPSIQSCPWFKPPHFARSWFSTGSFGQTSPSALTLFRKAF